MKVIYRDGYPVDVDCSLQEMKSVLEVHNAYGSVPSYSIPKLMEKLKVLGSFSTEESLFILQFLINWVMRSKELEAFIYGAEKYSTTKPT